MVHFELIFIYELWNFVQGLWLFLKEIIVFLTTGLKYRNVTQYISHICICISQVRMIIFYWNSIIQNESDITTTKCVNLFVQNTKVIQYNLLPKAWIPKVKVPKKALPSTCFHGSSNRIHPILDNSNYYKVLSFFESL